MLILEKLIFHKKIETKEPVVVIGEAPAVTQKNGVLLTHLNDVTVEALPDQIPSNIEVDISSLIEIGSEIKVSGLPKSDKYTIKEDLEKPVVSVIEHKEESLVAETTPTGEPEIIEQKAEGEEVVEGEEGKAAPEAGEKVAEAPKGEPKKDEKPSAPKAEPKPEPKK